MKRYRLFGMSFDTRAGLLGEPINEGWAEHVKEAHRASKKHLEESFVWSYGEQDREVRLQNAIDLGSMNMSVMAFHNVFHEQVRNAFIIGAYYPALTGACSLGERILNHLVLKLREEYRSTPEFHHVKGKDSIDDWNKMVKALSAWSILLPEVTAEFYKLEEMRHGAVHFRPEVDSQPRSLALAAIKSLSKIIEVQFGAFGLQPWFIPIGWGEVFIRKSWENHPFIKEVYLPNCWYVGPKYTVAGTWPKFYPVDVEYENREITDEEFIALKYPDRYGSIADVKF